MLASFVIHLQPEQNAFLKLNTGSLLHAVFLHLISQDNPALATSLHSDAETKPFTVSQLQGKFARTGQHVVALTTGTYWFRITTLNEVIFASLSRVLMPRLARGEKLVIGETPFHLLDVKLEPTADNPWGCLSSYQQIYEEASVEEQITLTFQSPTAFKHRRKNLLFPLPLNVFQSYWQKWNAFSDLPLSANLLSWIEDNVAVGAHRLHTKALMFSDFQFHGFLGSCRYRVLQNNARYAKELNVLADFAFYCGTGAKTTMGMGQTRRIK